PSLDVGVRTGVERPIPECFFQIFLDAVACLLERVAVAVDRDDEQVGQRQTADAEENTLLRPSQFGKGTTVPAPGGTGPNVKLHLLLTGQALEQGLQQFLMCAILRE